MSEGAWFLLGMAVWLVFCFGSLGAAWNFDRIVVMVLDVVDIPVFAEARMIAALIYHPARTLGDHERRNEATRRSANLAFTSARPASKPDGAFGKMGTEYLREADHLER